MNWNIEKKVLVKSFQFKNFLEGMNFANRIATIAEDLNHHPNILIRYNDVKVMTYTHDAGKITQKDYELAEKIDKIIKDKFKKNPKTH